MKLKDMPYWGEKKPLSKFEAYLDLCDRKNKGHPIQISELAREWEWHRNTVRKFIEDFPLIEDNEITYKKDDNIDFLERDLEDIIWDAQATKEGRMNLEKRGLSIDGKMFRQVELGRYGRLDLLTASIFKRTINATIYELKGHKVNAQTMSQAAKYGTAIREYVGNVYEGLNISIRYILIGRELDLRSDFVYLYNESSLFEIYTYSFDIDGISFHNHDKSYCLEDGALPATPYPITKKELRGLVLPNDWLPF